MTTPLVSPPFGRDTSCTDQMRFGTLVSGRTLLVEWAYRCLRTDRNSLEDAANPDAAADYGLNLTKVLNHGMTPAALLSVQSQIVNALKKDPRIDSVDALITKTDAQSWNVAITIYDIEGNQADLALNVTDVDVTLLGGAT